MPYSVGDVPSYELASVDAEESLLSALETMFENDYSQLGIEREGEVIGIVSYRSIARVMKIMRELGVDEDIPHRSVTIAIEDVEPVIESSDELVDLFDLLAEHSYVIVDDRDEDALQILTNYDLLHYLRDAIEPFLMIEDIERSIRDLLRDAYPGDLAGELRTFFEDQEVRTPDGVLDCSFGHYASFICGRWSTFGEYFEEDGDFVYRLIEEVRKIRNRMFHFRSSTQESAVDYELLTFAHGYFQRRVSTRLGD